MINEEKVRELFNIALCDSKSDDSRVQKQSASYYGWDYIWKEGLKSFFTGTFAFAGLVVMWVAVNAAELLDRINKLDFKAMGVTIGILYIAFMAVYIFVTIVVYTARYKAGRREVRKYANHLKAVGRIYSREEKMKRYGGFMNKLLEIKDKAVKFCGEYEHFILPVVRFAVAFIAFITIDLNIGYMAKISSMLVALLLALVCALLPVNAILWIASIMILLDMYALSIEVFAITFVLFLVLYFVYFRFAPKDGMLVILTPICFQLHIPSVMPVAAGLLRRAYSVVAIICGTLLYYFLDGIRQNASALAEVVDKKGQSTTKLNVTMGQLLDNKEMFIVMAIFVITTLVVYQVRRLKINNSWTVATIAGGLVQLVALVVAYLVLGLPEKIIWLVLSTVAAIFAGVVIQFIFMNLDYARTENVQFEDDEYYYYVKAVPKKMIAKEEKVVKHFGNTGSLGKKIQRHNQENISKEAIAKDLEIDENIFEDDK